jgi:hypothetical protein
MAGSGATHQPPSWSYSGSLFSYYHSLRVDSLAD